MNEQEYIVVSNLAHIQNARESLRKVLCNNDNPNGLCGVGISKDTIFTIMKMLSDSEIELLKLCGGFHET